jgi:hypothetical protein
MLYCLDTDSVVKYPPLAPKTKVCYIEVSERSPTDLPPSIPPLSSYSSPSSVLFYTPLQSSCHFLHTNVGSDDNLH